VYKKTGVTRGMKNESQLFVIVRVTTERTGVWSGLGVWNVRVCDFLRNNTIVYSNKGSDMDPYRLHIL
jgi:hypothetical protein